METEDSGAVEKNRTLGAKVPPDVQSEQRALGLDG